MNIAIVGATGLVGQTMLEVLYRRNFAVDKLLPVASARSRGQQVYYGGIAYTVQSIEEALQEELDIALFSAGSDVSKKWAQEFARKGTRVIDNSSAWRMDPSKKLIVPEINADEVTHSDYIIANPNCSTIQMVMSLAPLHRKYGLKRLVIATYQSVTGTGNNAVRQLEGERQGLDVQQVYPHPIDKNALPHCDAFMDNGYTKEEMKLVNETRKILRAEELAITATAVRIPVDGGHGEAVIAELKQSFTIADIRKLLSQTPGVILKDEPKNNVYPTPLNAKGKDEVFVGRLRKDISAPNAVSLWIVADNLRKGAATNAVQIAECVAERFL